MVDAVLPGHHQLLIGKYLGMGHLRVERWPSETTSAHSFLPSPFDTYFMFAALENILKLIKVRGSFSGIP
jgi:hypothetical protein